MTLHEKPQPPISAREQKLQKLFGVPYQVNPSDYFPPSQPELQYIPPLECTLGVPFSINPDLNAVVSKDYDEALVVPVEFKIGTVTGRIVIKKLLNFYDIDPETYISPAGVLPIENENPDDPNTRPTENTAPLDVHVELDVPEHIANSYSVQLIYKNAKHEGDYYSYLDDEQDYDEEENELYASHPSTSTVFECWAREEDEEVYSCFWPQDPTIFDDIEFVITKQPESPFDTAPTKTPPELVLV